MKVIIDIPEEVYHAVRCCTHPDDFDRVAWNAIHDGVPLKDEKRTFSFEEAAKHLGISEEDLESVGDVEIE